MFFHQATLSHRKRALSRICRHLVAQREAKASWDITKFLLCSVYAQLPISAYAVCLTHPQILDVSTGAPGGDCANSAISNMTNIYHMCFVFSSFFHGKDCVSWQIPLVLSLQLRTQALGIASPTGSRRW